MSTALEAASLVMVPSGYEDGTLASVKPTDGTGDFTFSRGSDISATRVNADGYIEKGYENLLLQSNSFDTTWSKSSVNVTGGQAGYDGTNNAWLLEAFASTSARVEQPISSNVSTLSIYAKAGTANWLRLNAGTGGSVYFDLENGVVGNVDSQNIDNSITSIGNGWYKITSVVPSTTYFRVYPATSNGSLATAGDNIYIQDAMLNQGLVTYPYIETTTAPVAGGILEDMPRLDYSNGSCPALLLEPSRTNLVEHSEYFGGFSFTNSSIETNSITSPEGLQNASSLIDTISNVAHRLRTQYFIATSGSTYTASLFIKKGSVDFLQLTFSSGQFGSNYVWFNLTNYSVDSVASGASATIEVFGNDWYKLTYTITAVAGGISYIFINPSDSTSSIFYTGSNSANLHLYGLQLEQDATYPTSYIPTYGVSQTRLRDDCVNAGDSSLFNSTGGVLFFEASALFDDTTRRHISVSDGSTANRLILRYDTSSNSIQTFVQVEGIIYANLRTSNYTITDNLKMAFKWESGNQKLYVNGQIVDSSTDVFAFSQNILNNLSFTRGGTSQPFYGNTKQLAYFPTALTDEECIQLTTV